MKAGIEVNNNFNPDPNKRPEENFWSFLKNTVINLLPLSEEQIATLRTYIVTHKINTIDISFLFWNKVAVRHDPVSSEKWFEILNHVASIISPLVDSLGPFALNLGGNHFLPEHIPALINCIQNVAIQTLLLEHNILGWNGIQTLCNQLPRFLKNFAVNFKKINEISPAEPFVVPHHLEQILNTSHNHFLNTKELVLLTQNLSSKHKLQVLKVSLVGGNDVELNQFLENIKQVHLHHLTLHSNLRLQDFTYPVSSLQIYQTSKDSALWATCFARSKIENLRITVHYYDNTYLINQLTELFKQLQSQDHCLKEVELEGTVNMGQQYAQMIAPHITKTGIRDFIVPAYSPMQVNGKKILDAACKAERVKYSEATHGTLSEYLVEDAIALVGQYVGTEAAKYFTTAFRQTLQLSEEQNAPLAAYAKHKHK